MKTVHKGFTLIELLIVVAIISALAAFIVLTPISTTKKARDARRMSDLQQYHAAMEAYANKNGGFYLARTSANDASGNTVCGTAGMNLSSCPEDSQSPASGYRYRYQTRDGANGSASATEFVFWTRIESRSGTNYLVVCSTGRSGISSAIPTSGICPATLN